MVQKNILFLLIFVLFLYLISQYCRKPKNETLEKKIRNNFTDSNNLTELDYVKEKVSELSDSLTRVKLKCSNKLNRGTKKCVYGDEYLPVFNDMKNFNTDINLYSANTNEKINKMYNNIDNTISEHNRLNSSNVTNCNVITDDFEKTMCRILKQRNQNKLLLPSTIKTHPPNLESFFNTENFNHIYSIIPYQYKNKDLNFNNIMMILDTNNENDLNTMKFFLVTNDSPIQLLVTYEIDNIEFVDNTILDKLENNIYSKKFDVNGIKFDIKQKKLNIGESFILKQLTDILDNLNIMVNNTYYIFKSNQHYDKVFYNYGKNNFYGENEDKYHVRSNRQIYRLFNEHSKSLLSMVKTD